MSISLGKRLKYTLKTKSKLDEVTVAAIKRDLASGMRSKDACEKYGVPRGTMGGIASGMNWGWVQP